MTNRGRYRDFGMASGKQSRRRRQVQAPPPVRGPGRGRRASPKVLIGAAVALILAAAIAAAVLALTGKSSSSSSSGEQLSDVAAVHRLFADIPQRGNVLGRPGAPVTLVEYVDLQCPFCQAFETQVLPKLVPRYVRTGKVRVVMRPIAFIGPDSERGRLAALAAARQNRLFDFSELLYFNQGAENSGWLDDAMIRRAAASIPGLDVGTLLGERNSSSIRGQAVGYDSQAQADGVQSTPTILVGRSGGALRQVANDFAPISAAIRSASRG
jgi:protein-disulfide isomerase